MKKDVKDFYKFTINKTNNYGKQMNNILEN